VLLVDLDDVTDQLQPHSHTHNPTEQAEGHTVSSAMVRVSSCNSAMPAAMRPVNMYHWQ
jgi:hypothetical protein